MCMCFFDVKVPENDLKKIETCRSVNESYIKMCVYNNAAFVGIIYLIIHKHMDMDNIKITKINKPKVINSHNRHPR